MPFAHSGRRLRGDPRSLPRGPQAHVGEPRCRQRCGPSQARRGEINERLALGVALVGVLRLSDRAHARRKRRTAAMVIQLELDVQLAEHRGPIRLHARQLRSRRGRIPCTGSILPAGSRRRS